MCGICGIFNLDGSLVDRAVLARMTARIAHRGPDSDGFYYDDSAGVGLGFRRLAIIDLNTGEQPMYNENRTLATVYNGEIYNYQSLRALLHEHTFASQTDTEVLVHGYESWGWAGLTERLRGMYAFALWDSTTRELLLVRDRLGQKPLYYAQWGQTIAFASEIKALLEHPAARRALNREALPEYLLLGYVLPPRTLFDGIHKLAAGHVAQITRHGLTTTEYWRPTLSEGRQSRADYAEQVRAKLQETVEMQLMSDVPLGTFLSGGVDSTTITALTRRMTGRPVQTFTVGFDFAKQSSGDQKFNVDLHHAESAARALGCDHHAIILRHDELLARLLPQLVYALDEPIADSSIIQTVFVTALARANGVPVLLSGDGADEIFAGYPFFHTSTQLQRYMTLLPAPLRRLINPILRRTGSDSLTKLADKSELHGWGAHFLTWEANIAPQQLGRVLRDSDIAQAGLNNLMATINGPLAPLPTQQMGDRIGYARLAFWLAENSNMRFDKMSMWMSIESRSPFQDHELVDLALGIPLHHKLPDGGKAVLKDAVSDLLPPDVLRRPKWGFNPPISDWLRGPLRPLVDEYCSAARLESLGLNADAILPMIEAHMERRAYHLHEIWNLLLLGMWSAIYLEQSLPIDERWSAETLTRLSQA